MTANIKLNQKGFTIVETLIVLAIAAVIIIIVLLAVPALQRTTRNTDIKNDAAAIAGALNDFESNNGGAQPTFIGHVANTSTAYICNTTSGNGAATTNATCVAAAAGATATVQSGDTIQTESATTAVTWAAAPASATQIGPSFITVDFAYTCISTTGNNATGGTFTGSGTQSAVLYPDETGGTNGQVECIQG